MVMHVHFSPAMKATDKRLSILRSAAFLPRHPSGVKIVAGNMNTELAHDYFFLELGCVRHAEIAGTGVALPTSTRRGHQHCRQQGESAPEGARLGPRERAVTGVRLRKVPTCTLET